MIVRSSTAYTDAFFGVPGGVYALDARRLGIAYLDGDPVRYAPDLIGQGQASEETLAQRPTFDANLYGLVFSGARRLILPPSCRIRLSTGLVAFMVWRPTSYLSRAIMSWAGAASADRAWYLIAEGTNASDTTISAQIGNTTFASAPGQYDTGVDYIICLRIRPDRTFEVRLNGVQIISGTGGAVDASTTSEPTLGARSEPLAFGGRNITRSFRMYRGMMSDVDVATIEAKLAYQWGIPVQPLPAPPPPTGGTIGTESGDEIGTESGQTLIIEDET